MGALLSVPFGVASTGDAFGGGGSEASVSSVSTGMAPGAEVGAAVGVAVGAAADDR